MDITNSIGFVLLLISSSLVGLIILFSAYNNGSNGFYATPFYKRLIVSLPFIVGSIYFFNTNNFTVILVGYILLFIYKIFKFYP